MDLIETLEPSAFTEYLKRYNNTICGRHPIGVMLQVRTSFIFFIIAPILILCLLISLLQSVKALQARGYRMSFKFLQYSQSSKCFNMSDSSVSYAAGSLIFE